MSYSTELIGRLKLSKPVDETVRDLINALYNDGGDGEALNSIFAEMYPNQTSPSDWCPWKISDDCKFLEPVDGLYELNNNDAYCEWLAFLIIQVFIRLGLSLTGEVQWRGEDIENDTGLITVKKNNISAMLWLRTNFECDDIDVSTDGEFIDPVSIPCFEQVNDLLKEIKNMKKNNTKKKETND